MNHEKPLKRSKREKVRPEKPTETLPDADRPEVHWGVANNIGEVAARALNQSVLKKKRG
jgi:hypothetical protein